MTSYDKLTDWIAQQTVQISNSRYGRNEASIQQGIQDQTQKSSLINSYSEKVKQVLAQTSDADKKKTLEDSFCNLKAVIDKKLHCLQTMLQVAALEENCSWLSHELDERCALLAKNEEQSMLAGEHTSCGQNIMGFIARSSQDCVFGMRDNWDWVGKLVKCVDIHLKNGSAFHQFYHEVEESEPWMMSDFARIGKVMESTGKTTSGNEEETNKLAADLDTVFLTLRQWEAKVNRLWDDASRLTPVSVRVESVKTATPARALADYETHEISVREGEDLLLLDNSDSKRWKVRNGKGEEAFIPAPAVLIPGPDRNAVESASRLRLKLLAAWTTVLKKIGKRLIYFMLHVFKPEYRPEEIASLTSMAELDKSGMLNILSFIEDTLKKHWSDHEGFINLQERILQLRMVLEEFNESENPDENLFKTLISQIATLGKVMELYQEMFRDWDKFKVVVESSRAPELMLIVDKWEQLQFVGREYFAKFWKSSLPLDETDATMSSMRKFTLDGVVFEDTVDVGFGGKSSEENGSLVHGSNTLVTKFGRGVDGGSASDGYAMERDEKVMNVESVSVSNMEVTADLTASTNTENHTHPDGGSSGSGSSGSGSKTTRRIMNAAVSVDHGASEEGFDELREATVVSGRGSGSVSDVDGTDFGVATETRTAQTEQLSSEELEVKKTFVIRSVVNPNDQSEISLQQAIMLGVIRPNEGVYVNSITGDAVPIAKAMNDGLIKVSFSTTKKGQEKKTSIGIITVKTTREVARPYLIKSAKDTRTGEDLSQDAAAKMNIIDERQGTYVDLATGKRMLIVEAAEKGFVEIEYTGEGPAPQVIQKTYAVRAVVDRRQKKTITFHDAVRTGIIDKENGTYKDTVTLDKMYIGDAIMRGFLKARIIDDDAGLDVDPQNQMVIDKTNIIRQRFLKPLAIIRAFKAAGKTGSPFEDSK